MDYYLKATDEQSLYAALESAGVAQIVWLGRGEIVADPALEAVLDQQALDADLSCVYQGQHFAARAGKWLILLPTATAKNGYALDVIGTISRPTGILDAEGNPVMETLPGYHANLRGELTDAQMALLPLIAKPNNPARVWA